MRRRQTQPLGEIIQELLKLQHLDRKLNETRLLDSWVGVVGGAISKYTSDLYIKNKVLYVKISSAVLRNELLMSRQILVDSLNKNVGAEVITDIRFC